LVALFAAGVLAGCGRAPAAHVPRSEWRANAKSVVQQLRVDVSDTALGGTTRASASAALKDVSTLYALLVAYSDIDGCSKMVAATNAPERVTRKLARACLDLERASALFTRAMRSSDPAALAAATRRAHLADPQLVRAMLALS
jgi:hypothetical protein